jgi:4-hydroxy-3-methylbut-2-enyl diphosphate reductase
VKLITAKRAGFCFGVKRAIDIAFDTAEKKKAGVYTLGPIIHNPQVVERLQTMGVRSVNSVRDLARKDPKAVIVRTHGVTENIMNSLSKNGHAVIDATCPFVKKAQHYAKLLKEEGYKIIILGDKEHPEVKGIMSYAGRGAVVVKDASEFPETKARVGVIVQTTQNVEKLKELLAVAVGHTKELKVYNTICNSTALRLKETEEMAQRADVMLIVGGKNSANTTQLARLCQSLGVATYHIETASEIKDAWFSRAATVGLTAGASTPDWIIKEVKKRIKDIGGRRTYGHPKGRYSKGRA